MGSIIQEINYIRAGTKVKRNHTMPTIMEETVGLHSCNVALLAIAICSKTDFEPDRLVRHALCHDLAEQVTGDVPAPAKWASPELKSVLEVVETKATLPLFNTSLSNDEKQIFKCLDLLDYAMQCSNELHMGNKYMGDRIPIAIGKLKEQIKLIEHSGVKLIIEEIVDEFS